MKYRAKGGANGDACPLSSRIPTPPSAPPRCRRLHTSPVRNGTSPALSELEEAWKSSKRLSKQVSMETKRELKWERRRRQILKHEKKKQGTASPSSEGLTDEDFHELKGSIELGFGFNEDAGQQLSGTLPALDLYLAVNRQVSPSPVSSPHSQASCSSMAEGAFPSESPKSQDPWKICSPGESPRQVKMRLRYWAQAVACSVMQST